MLPVCIVSANLQSDHVDVCVTTDLTILQVRAWDDLPDNARKYVERVEELVGTSCSYIGVGPGRDAIVMRHTSQGSNNGAKSLQPV